MVQNIKQIIDDAEVVIITAGAGMGVDSGLPDFRGNEGMWKAYPALGDKKINFSTIANPQTFEKQPDLAWAFYGHRYDLYKKTVPHNGFNALLDLVKKKKDYFVVTSNVDGAFQKAGFDSEKVYEIHGRIEYFQCTCCKVAPWKQDMTFNINPSTLDFNGVLPSCPECGELARPNIMLFNDLSFDTTLTDKQEKDFNTFMHKYDTNNTKIVVIEFGAGTAIPSIRLMGEFITNKIDSAVLVRVNPRESQGPVGTISIAKGAKEAIFNDLI